MMHVHVDVREGSNACGLKCTPSQRFLAAQRSTAAIARPPRLLRALPPLVNSPCTNRCRVHVPRQVLELSGESEEVQAMLQQQAEAEHKRRVETFGRQVCRAASTPLAHLMRLCGCRPTSPPPPHPTRTCHCPGVASYRAQRRAPSLDGVARAFRGKALCSRHAGPHGAKAAHRNGRRRLQ